MYTLPEAVGKDYGRQEKPDLTGIHLGISHDVLTLHISLINRVTTYISEVIDIASSNLDSSS